MTEEMPKFFEYMKFIGNLKKVPRTGWLRHGVKDPESVAEHMYRMAMITFALPSDSTLDREKCIKIALVHDVAESIVGDLTPTCGVSKADKSKMEEAASKHIASFLPDHGGQEMLKLWKEYETQSSPEAQFVKDMDKFEMLFQALEYERTEVPKGHLEEFFAYTKERHTFQSELVKKWAEDVVTVRNSVDDKMWNAGLSEAKKTMAPKLSSSSPSSSSSLSSVKPGPSVPAADTSKGKLSPTSPSVASGIGSSQANTKKLKIDAGGDSNL